MQKLIVSRRTRRQNQTLMTLQPMDKSLRCTVRSEGILGLSQSQLLAISKCSLVPCDLHLLPPLAPPYHFFAGPSPQAFLVLPGHENHSYSRVAITCYDPFQGDWVHLGFSVLVPSMGFSQVHQNRRQLRDSQF